VTEDSVARSGRPPARDPLALSGQIVRRQGWGLPVGPLGEPWVERGILTARL
jgi:hypothetical protein